MDAGLFDVLAERVEALLGRLRELKEENTALREALAEREERSGRLAAQLQAAEEAKAEGRQRLEGLVRRLEEEVGQG